MKSCSLTNDSESCKLCYCMSCRWKFTKNIWTFLKDHCGSLLQWRNKQQWNCKVFHLLKCPSDPITGSGGSHPLAITSVVCGTLKKVSSHIVIRDAPIRIFWADYNHGKQITGPFIQQADHLILISQYQSGSSTDTIKSVDRLLHAFHTSVSNTDFNNQLSYLFSVLPLLICYSYLLYMGNSLICLG